ncbi:MAG: hypothetical protein IPO42_10925 [Chitinophagaceae bacterium]|nr:hypothetical protein [Chitinophagaceae bacterium]
MGIFCGGKVANAGNLEFIIWYGGNPLIPRLEYPNQPQQQWLSTVPEYLHPFSLQNLALEKPEFVFHILPPACPFKIPEILKQLYCEFERW